MNRKEFIKKSCIVCSSVSVLASILESCASVRYAEGKLNENGLLLDKKQFAGNKEERSYVIVRHDDLQFPICVYKLNGSDYKALWMQCTHQGAELQAAGDMLICPAHGSEFDKKGKAIAGPASADLRTFPVTVQGEHLFIDLRKQSS